MDRTDDSRTSGQKSCNATWRVLSRSQGNNWVQYHICMGWWHFYQRYKAIYLSKILTFLILIMVTKVLDHCLDLLKPIIWQNKCNILNNDIIPFNHFREMKLSYSTKKVNLTKCCVQCCHDVLSLFCLHHHLCITWLLCCPSGRCSCSTIINYVFLTKMDVQIGIIEWQSITLNIT